MAKRISKILGSDGGLMRVFPLLAVLLIFNAGQLRADEATRRAQEELRKRNLYFGDINGRTNPELIEAIKRYQTRKGFNSTGELDQETARSMKIEIAASNEIEPLPDLPVLKSDSARELAEPDAAKLEDAAADETPGSSSPAPPGEFLTQQEQSQQERITKFVEQYLRDGETNDVDLQVRYYAFPVQYFDHGKAGREFVVKDTSNYVKRWPKRKYTLLGPVKFLPGEKPGQIQVEFTIDFNVTNGERTAHGKTRNLWTIESERENFKILVINEQRLHD